MRGLVLDHGYVDKAEEAWGSDEKIIEAARMSTSKGFQGWGVEGWICQECKLSFCIDMGTCKACGGGLKPRTPGDEKLLKYLWDHNHHTPFEMAGMCFEIQAPIFVAREVFRHRTFSYNELSARYVALPDLYYIPSVERLMNGKQATSNKQASEAGFQEWQAKELQGLIEASTKESRENYEQLLLTGLSRELARLVIPMNQYTRWRMSGNLRNWLQFLALRLPENVQWETRQFANMIAAFISEAFPRTYELFRESNELPSIDYRSNPV